MLSVIVSGLIGNVVVTLIVSVERNYANYWSTYNFRVYSHTYSPLSHSMASERAAHIQLNCNRTFVAEQQHHGRYASRI